MNTPIAMVEIKDPKEAIVFQAAKESG